MSTTKRMLPIALLLFTLLAGCGMFGGGQETDPEVGGGINPPATDEENTVLPTDGESPENGETAEPTAPATTLPRFALGNAEQLSPPMVSTLPAGTTVQHTVQQGEWLHQIARCYGASFDAVLALNPIPNPNFIIPERVVTVPNIGSDGLISGPPCVQPHTVQMGESFDSLAAQFGSTPDVLQRANPGALFTGRVVFVPDNRLTVVATEPPTLSQTLLFNHDGDLAVWQANGELEIFFDAESYLLDLVTNGSGDFLLTKQTSNGTSMEILLLNRATNTAVLLESDLPTDISYPFQESMVIAEDGQHAVYSVREGNSFRLVSVPTSNPESRQTQPLGHEVEADQIPQLFTGPDNGRFYLLDRSGIYELSYALDAEPRQLHAIEPNNFDQPLLFTALDWSPTGRYLLLRGGFLEGSALFVLDSETGSFVEVPGTGSYIISNDGGWRPDGRFVTLSFGAADSSSLQTAVFLPQTDESGTLTLIQESSSPATLPNEGGVGFTWLANLPPVQPNNDQLTAVLHADTLSSPGLFQTAPSGTALNRAASFGDEVSAVSWSPDGRSAIVTTFSSSGSTGDVLHITLDESQPYSLVDWLGLQIADFHWVSGE